MAGPDTDRHECAICFGIMKKRRCCSNVSRCPICHQRMHYTCLNLWMIHGGTTCPFCRAVLPASYVFNHYEKRSMMWSKMSGTGLVVLIMTLPIAVGTGGVLLPVCLVATMTCVTSLCCSVLTRP